MKTRNGKGGVAAPPKLKQLACVDANDLTKIYPLPLGATFDFVADDEVLNVRDVIAQIPKGAPRPKLRLRIDVACDIAHAAAQKIANVYRVPVSVSSRCENVLLAYRRPALLTPDKCE
jgi:hypothetical protein